MENTKKTTIEITREALANFPEKKNATHKEIIDLMSDYDEYLKWENDNKANNDKLKAKYKEIEPLINKVSEASKVLIQAEYELNRVIDDIFKEKIEEANKDYKNYVIVEHLKGENANSIDKSNARPIDTNSTIYELIKQREDLKNLRASEQIYKIQRLLYNGYRDDTWLRNESYYDSKREIEKKLKTRLKKLGLINE